MTENEYRKRKLDKINREEGYETILIDEESGYAVTKEILNDKDYTPTYVIMRYKAHREFWDVHDYTANLKDAMEIFFNLISK